MINPARKRLTLVILVVVVVILSGAILAQFEGRTNPPAASSSTSSSSSASATQQESTSSTQQISAISTQRESTSSLSIARLFLSWGGTPRLLGPGSSIDYTLKVSNSSDIKGALSFSYSALGGISLTFTPSTVVLATAAVAIDVTANASRSAVPGDYPVVVRANGPSGSFNETFDFQVVQHLVIIPPSEQLASNFSPENQTVTVGSTVTWLNLDNGGAEGQVGTREVKFADLNVTSPVLSVYDLWSYTFTRPGTFAYIDPLYPTSGGTVIVVQP